MSMIEAASESFAVRISLLPNLKTLLKGATLFPFLLRIASVVILPRIGP